MGLVLLVLVFAFCAVVQGQVFGGGNPSTRPATVPAFSTPPSVTTLTATTSNPQTGTPQPPVIPTVPIPRGVVRLLRSMKKKKKKKKKINVNLLLFSSLQQGPLGCESGAAPLGDTITFAYKNMFAGSKSQYCCPHRFADVVLNGTSPMAVVGTATLNDGPFGLGVRVVVDASVLLRSHVVTLSMRWKNVNNTGLVPVIASAIVQGSLPTVLSGYFLLPQFGLNTTLGYDLEFAVNDNGLVAPSNFQQQWTQALGPANFVVLFPARTEV
jgi:hypothetical protein